MSVLVGCSGKDSSTRFPFHFSDNVPESPLVRDGLFHPVVLLLGEGNGDRFAGNFAGPLVTGASSLAVGSILDGSLGDKSNLAELLSERTVTAERWLFCGLRLFHEQKL